MTTSPAIEPTPTSTTTDEPTASASPNTPAEAPAQEGSSAQEAIATEPADPADTPAEDFVPHETSIREGGEMILVEERGFRE